MKISFLKSIQRFAITELGKMIDSDENLDALMMRHGMLSKETEQDDPFLDEEEDFEFEDFFDADDNSGLGIEPCYIKRHVSRIPQYGDDSRWRLADYLNMFDNLNRDGSLTDEQRQAVDNFAIGWSQSNG